MLDQLKQLFKTPTADELARREYDEARRGLLSSQSAAEARRELLSSQSAAEYHQSMIEYHIKRLLRLKEIINAEADDK